MVAARHGETPGFREEVLAFLADNLTDDWAGVGSLAGQDRVDFVNRWRLLCGAKGYLAVTWPVEYGGRGLGKLDQLAVVEEFAHARVPVGSPGDTISIKLFGNTVARWGTHEQKARFLPRIMSGEDIWCQGYSEPGAGSDLSSLRTRAVLEDGQWRINGQKIWTSNGTSANQMFLLARTNTTVSNSKGITMLVLPTDQSGIDIRPIKMVTGTSGFCEVFLTDARAEEHDVIGEVDGGWAVATGLLSQERGEEAATNPVLFAYELDRVFNLAREKGLDKDPLVRARLATCFRDLAIMKAMGDRILDAYIRDGSLGPASSISKLYWSEYHLKVTSLAIDLLGVEALTWEGAPPMRWFRADDPGAPNDSASWLTVYLRNAFSGTVYAGTSEVQRNIIAERILGLPREAQVR
ncbi:acyl-CoA dehydrogenase family protein [soil metagenome]